ncbi:MAG: DNA replication/repair protein RecF [Phenylobacterium sp.]|uniref:DNA replication/repair protein RecF n=1 Tax=Phenylobacterium sp. TaxID=1871053 RepID=UPI001B4AEA0D|nr:DNA replication/repair protein RecF [Phenylobacterium sp.]MBP7816364.1 DNA replication/repair protein RecF [Phenylobacterium sp.]MBP9231355.1 DNA replication/repair protein RecF [Phenylobacterium sp.]MBP9755629.1 DNA replication/repair protein RecF [Phenylobacterium sp.]
MTRTALTRLTLTDFRSYGRAELPLDGRPVYLIGPNGAGKTNLLEAISLLTPGRGLRGASLAEVGRRMPGEAQGRAWAVAATIEIDGEPVRLGTGTEVAGAARRTVRLEGEPVPPGRLADHQRQVWLTPAQDRLFLEGAGDRRRFFDRLVFAAEPAHAAHATAYEKSQRERMRLLTDGPADADWLSALEARLAEAGALMAAARARTLSALQSEIDERGDRPFPQARLSLSGPWEQMAREGVETGEIEARLAGALAAARERDAAAGRMLTGPHRGDLEVIHAEKDRPAAECSTGEQKALILNLVLGQAARLSRAESGPNPILLLDEVAAHLDRRRRAALFDEITALKLQAFLTGTDEQLFEDLKGRAQGVHVDGSSLAYLDTE